MEKWSKNKCGENKELSMMAHFSRAQSAYVVVHGVPTGRAVVAVAVPTGSAAASQLALVITKTAARVQEELFNAPVLHLLTDSPKRQQLKPTCSN